MKNEGWPFGVIARLEFFLLHSSFLIQQDYD